MILKVKAFLIYTPDGKQHALIGLRGEDGKDLETVSDADNALGEKWTIEPNEGIVRLNLEIDVPDVVETPTINASLKVMP